MKSQKKVAAVVKLPYETPRLIEYGALRELTAAGSGTQMEGGAVTTKFP